jgi:hypothetical protein
MAMWRAGELPRSVPGQTIGHVYIVHVSNRRCVIITRLQLETCILNTRLQLYYIFNK